MSLISGYPAAGDFTIRETGVANWISIKKTTGATFFGGAIGIGLNPTVKLDVNGVDGTTSYIVGRFNGGTSGYGAFLQFTDANTYNYSFGTAPSGDFTWYSGRYPGAAGTLRMTLSQAGALSLFGKVASYNNVATEGYGVPAIVDDIALVNQVADIGATNFTNAATAGTYTLDYYLQTKAIDITAGVVTVTIGWTDNLGARTSAFVVNLAGANATNGTIHIRNSGANITYTVTHTGLYGIAAFDLYMTMMRVS